MLEHLAALVMHAIAYVVRDIVVDFFLFNVGRGALLALALGRYPHGRALERDEGTIAGAGFVVVVLTGVALALYNNLFAIV